MRRLLLALVVALTAVVPTGCAFGFKSDVRRDREHTMLYAPPESESAGPAVVTR